MRAGIVFAAIAAAAVIIIAAVNIFGNSGSSGEGFTVYDESSHLHHFSEYTGKPLIINICVLRAGRSFRLLRRCTRSTAVRCSS